MIVRGIFTFYVSLLFCGVATASPMDDGVAAAQKCAVAGDYKCAFGVLIDLAANEGMPLADNEIGVEYLTGAMLESSLIHASDDWSASSTREAAERYLDVVREKHPDLNIFYATGHTLRAISCGELGEVNCRSESVTFLCDNKSRLVAPMGGHPSHQDFGNRKIRLMMEECGEAS